MLFQYKFYKYQEKNRLLIGGNGDELTPQKQQLIDTFIELYVNIRKNPHSININIAIALKKLIKKHTWLHVPSIDDVGHNVFTKPNYFNVTKFWHPNLQPHSGASNTLFCPGCLSTSKLDQRSSDLNPYISHHVDQHLFRISDKYLYTYNLVTCSTLTLIQHGYIGMMHIDAGNTYEDMIEFLNEFKNTVGSFDQTLKIHGFFNGNIFDETNKFILLPVYDLIFRQYNTFGHSMFENILMNLPFTATSMPNIPMSLYIFAIPDGSIKGFYIDSSENIPQYISGVHLIKIYEQQLLKPEIISNKLKQTLDISLLIELVNYIGVRYEVTTENVFDLLNYAIEPIENEIDNILKIKQFLMDHNFDPKYFLLEMYNSPV